MEYLLCLNKEFNMEVQITPKLSIHDAAAKGRYDIVETWLKKDSVYIDSQADFHNTPLHLAARQGHPAIVQLLLTRGANPCAKNQNEDTPLSYVVCQFEATEQHNQVVALLLQKDSTANHFTYSNSNDSLLHVASERGHAEIVRLLLMQGADPNTVSRGYTAWHVGCNECTPDIIATFLKHPNINPDMRRESDGKSVIQSIVLQLARTNLGKEQYKNVIHPMGKRLYAEHTHEHNKFIQYLRYFVFSGVTLNEEEIRDACNTYGRELSIDYYPQITDLINEAFAMKQEGQEMLSSFPPFIIRYFLLSSEKEREGFLKELKTLYDDFTDKKSLFFRLSKKRVDQIMRDRLLGDYNFPDLNHNQSSVNLKARQVI
jgi:hypothetical protein